MKRTAIATLTVDVLKETKGMDQLPGLLEHLLSANAARIVLDMQNVQEIDGICLIWIIRTLNKLADAGTGVAVASPDYQLRRAFQETKLVRQFQLCPDVMSALRAVERAA